VLAAVEQAARVVEPGGARDVEGPPAGQDHDGDPPAELAVDGPPRRHAVVFAGSLPLDQVAPAQERPDADHPEELTGGTSSGRNI
jgi:hypothetical protein